MAGMFFHPLNIIPEEKTAEVCEEHKKSNKDFVLVLTPFHPSTRITLEVCLDTESTTTSFLHLKNNNDHALNINITKKPTPERCIELSFTSTIVEAKSTQILKITWSPKERGIWWDALHLTADNRVKYEVSLVMRARSPQKNEQDLQNSEIISPNSTQSYHLLEKIFTLQQESFYARKRLKSRNKRTRDFFLQEFNKENKSINKEIFSESTTAKKPRKEIIIPSTNSTHTFSNQEIRQKVFNFDISTENLRESYFAPRKYLENLFKIRRNEATDINFNVTSASEKSLRETSQIFSPIGKETTFNKRSRLVQNFKFSPPEISAPKNKIEFASRDLDSKAKEVLEANLWSRSESIFPEVALPESTNPQKSGKMKELSSTFNGKVRHFRKSIKHSVSFLTGINKKKRKSEKEDFNCQILNPDPFSVTTTEDPFLSSSSIDENWIHLQELEFKKWLNTLMTPSEDFNTETTSVDIAKIWQSSRMMEDVLPETKESISARYHTNTRLNTLRKAAAKMYLNEKVKKDLSGAIRCIENKRLDIKKDKDLHRDIGLQKEILELFFSYNPLWLRIGLETIFKETIPLKSNNDLIGLTRFLLDRFFSDPSIIKEHSHPTIVGMRLSSFTPNMNEFTLTKFLQVVYFLDYAKTKKLIGDDPCLFRKKASHKESRSIVQKFSTEVLSGIGDVTRVLRYSGYVLQHKQSFLEEFDYAVHDMSVDLRDGVRLCRAMELITGKRNLTTQCSVPANSKVQKVHNVGIALKALLDSGYVLTGEIDSKSIAEGHRQKTLSLLWQIIYKFQAPRFEKAATCLQKWWRSKLWYVRVKNLRKKRENDAALIIQNYWKRYLERKKIEDLKLMKKAVRIIERNWILSRNKRRENESALKIQRWWRRIWETRVFVENLRKRLKNVILVQRIWRSKTLMRKERAEFLKLKETCLKIQVRWRAKLVGKLERNEMEKLKNAVVFIQRKWRGLRLMKQERESYERIKNASGVIENWWKRFLILRKDRNDFLSMKNAVRIFEKSWIEKKTILEERKDFLEKRRNAIILQRFWRRQIATKEDVLQLQICKKSCVKIQSWWRSIPARREYELKKKSSVIIQKWWRSVKETDNCQRRFQRIKNAILIIQKNCKMLKARRNYQKMKIASVKIQSWFRMKVQRRKFETLLKDHKAVILIQKKWRDILIERQRKKAVILIEIWWKDILKKKRKEFEERMKKEARRNEAAIKIQSAFRGYKVRKAETSGMEDLRKKTEKAVRNSILAKTLADRLRESINIFYVANDLGKLSMCLASLDLITRLSNKSCIILCKVGLVDKVFETLDRSNRSLPWMEVSLRATSILVNLSKYPTTKPFVLKNEYIETLVRLMNITVEKEVELFLHLATLIWILIEDFDYAKAFLKDSRSVWLFTSLYNKVIRKKKQFSRGFCKGKEIMPSLKPDWGLKQKQPRLFSNVFHAVICIKEKLGTLQSPRFSI